ncbi:Deoxyribonuclease-1 [Echinococcus granulosus]|uniref:Deoxyribonuclease-1 n=1 Tax=Echinococcus granulosus TaxID=6210 RepID=W6U339_ECHGR|nr:Deoxyribonuclease-1 [Echinococcus granulosus]EUB54966.1 Deoxyribonuclease-1 [Echinococcus granulosus]
MYARTEVTSTISTSSSQNLVILGDLNADRSYLTKEARDKLRLRKDSRHKWRITDDMDTTVSAQKCSYDSLCHRTRLLLLLCPRQTNLRNLDRSRMRGAVVAGMNNG